jgi:hypothetical protein
MERALNFESRGNNHAPAGFYSGGRNSKLYFEVLKMFSVPENHLPLIRGENTSEVGVFDLSGN